ncbi:MAG: glycosyltransferase family 4 protein [Acidobacteriota bacterium]|nr:glycosyltransferase family 4 protein [Acidobacteriota bacterium]
MNKVVFHVDDSRNLRGGERQVLYLATGLEKLGGRSFIVCRARSPLDKEARKLGIETIHVPFLFEGDILSAFLLARRIKAVIRRLGPGTLPILHAHTGHAAAAVHLAGRFIPALKIVHRRVDFRPGGSSASIRKYQNADLVIALSAAIERILTESGVDGRKIRVIPSAVDLAAFERSPDGGIRKRLWGELNIPADALVIGSLMAMVPHKDPLNLIAAAEKVVQADDHCRFIIAGEGPLLEIARALVERLGMTDRIHLPGYRGDNADLLRAMDVFVLSSREEGLGSSIIEAMAGGLPVVGTDAGGIPELIEDGRNGFVVPKENPEALAQAILRLAGDADMRAGMGRSSYEMSRQYSIERMAAETLAAYDSVTK